MSPGEIPTAPRPSIGRIVIYREIGPTSEETHALAVDFPAIIRGVSRPDADLGLPETVDLSVFTDAGVTIVDGAVLSGGSPIGATIGDEPAQGTWRWPERVS